VINVLIVDDDPMVAELNRRYLEQVDGFRWQGSVSTIQAAKQMLLEGDTPIDLVRLPISPLPLRGLGFHHLIKMTPTW
jgi:two-component system response regulator DcuR